MKRSPDTRSCEGKSPEQERDRNKDKDKAKHSTMPSLRSENHVKLQPAPIPLVNPWNRKQVVPSNDQAFPPLPQPADDIHSSNKSDSFCSSANSRTSVNGKDARRPRASSVSSISTISKNPGPRSTSLRDSSISTLSFSSKQTLRAAAPRATENLWMHPFGTDVVVQTRTLSFQVHRNIVQVESGWLRENIPPPNTDGTPVGVFLDLAAEPVGHCLRFLYTQRMEICEPQEGEPWNIKHLPCCVLGYCAAVALRIPKLAVHMLRIVEETALEHEHQIATTHADQTPTDAEMYGFCCHYHNAMEILNQQGPKRLMKPMRLVMGKVADTTFFWLMRHPGFPHTMSASWTKLLPSISLDQAEYRRISSLEGDVRKSIVPSEDTLDKLFTESAKDGS